MYEYTTATSISPDDKYLVTTMQEKHGYGWEFMQVIKHEERVSPHSSKMCYIYWFRRQKQNNGEITVKFQ